MLDLIIKNGTVVDGSGAPGKRADVAIQGQSIVEVGQVVGKARRTIDAEGLLVTPGWVDIHTHYDGQATWDPILAPSSWHGVTTVVMGNCGVGFAPVRPGQEQFLIELMEGVEDIPGSALADGIDWQWEDFAGYLDALESKQRTIDVGTQVPHGAVRAYVMGTRCNVQDEVPTAAEIDAMATLVRDGIKAGALGFSSSRTWLHRDIHGVHVPGTFAGSDEMLALGMAMKGLDHGVFEMVSDHLGDDDEWAWVQSCARETGRPITLVATSQAAYEGGKMYRIAEEAERQGMNIRPQAAGRPTGILQGLQSNFHLFIAHPDYAALKDLPLAERVQRLRDPSLRARLIADKSKLIGGLGGSVDDMLKKVFPLGDVPNYEPDYEESIAGMAQARAADPIALFYDLMLENDGKALFYHPLGAYSNYNFDGFFKSTLEHPQVLFGLSDGGAHCGVIADAGMPTFILTHWARDRTKGDKLPLEYLVKKLCHDTAEAYGLHDRGQLKPGKLADINVIDFERLQLAPPEAIYDLPQNGKRLVQRAAGYRHTLKRGEEIFADSEHTGALPGRLVRGGAVA